MKIGRTLQDLAAEVDRQRQVKRDYLASTEHMRLIPGYPDKEDQTPKLLVGERDRGQILDVRSLAHEQIAAHVGVPMPYYKRMLAEAPALLCENVNTWFHRNPQPRMIRTLDGWDRAFLSNSYRPLDNDALLEAVLPPLIDVGAEIMSCEVTETRLYLKVVDKRIQRDVPTGRKLGDGSHVFFDTASPAMVLSNSEVGLGALSVRTSVFTHLCTNLAVVGERSTRKYHVGQRADIGEEVYALLSDSTRRLTDAALWAQIGDVVRGAFDRAQFDATCDKLAGAAEDKIGGDPVKIVDVTARRYMMSGSEQSSVLQHLIRGGDLTRYGLHAAITRAAEDLDNYDRASQFEQLGGKIIELPRNEWEELAKAA